MPAQTKEAPRVVTGTARTAGLATYISGAHQFKPGAAARSAVKSCRLCDGRHGRVEQAVVIRCCRGVSACSGLGGTAKTHIGVEQFEAQLAGPWGHLHKKRIIFIAGETVGTGGAGHAVALATRIGRGAHDQVGVSGVIAGDRKGAGTSLILVRDKAKKAKYPRSH